jgi:hypothetical protein
MPQSARPAVGASGASSESRRSRPEADLISPCTSGLFLAPVAGFQRIIREKAKAKCGARIRTLLGDLRLSIDFTRDAGG